MPRHNFKKLDIWKESMNLIDATYSVTSTFPDYEKYGLRSQMNRCSVSIASNIAEGTSKSTDKHLVKYLEDSLGSAFEWETQLNVIRRQDFITEIKFKELEDDIIRLQKKIYNFIERFK
ncbi:four helix bundle protein [Gangjinia marincola]|uniref:Four helix bundle protein n=1 Tax=Gangjinia marincola TaxID=578463 RepID=A0ABN1MFZ5_9FLAO